MCTPEITTYLWNSSQCLLDRLSYLTTNERCYMISEWPLPERHLNIGLLLNVLRLECRSLRSVLPAYQAFQLYSTDYYEYLLVDKAYDSSEFRGVLEDKGTMAVIPSKKNRLIQIPYDKHIYKERNFVERFFNRIKQFRRIATQYDKLAVTFMGDISIASILIWLKV